MSNYMSVIFGLTVLAASALSFINFGFIINNLDLIDLNKLNATNFSNSSFVACQNELETNIIPVNITALLLPFIVGFLIIITTFVCIYCRKYSFNFDSNVNAGISGAFAGLISIAFAFQIGWPLVTPVLTIVYSYGYAVLSKCTQDVRAEPEWYLIFEGLKSRYLACIIVCSLGDFLLFFWIFVLVFHFGFSFRNSFSQLENII